MAIILPQLPTSAIQPDADTPGLYLQCESVEQREAIMRALGFRGEIDLKPDAGLALKGVT
jgi:hypothetical protein